LIKILCGFQKARTRTNVTSAFKNVEIISHRDARDREPVRFINRENVSVQDIGAKPRKGKHMRRSLAGNSWMNAESPVHMLISDDSHIHDSGDTGAKSRSATKERTGAEVTVGYSNIHCFVWLGIAPLARYGVTTNL
jgi:hypothetical protein